MSLKWILSAGLLSPAVTDCDRNPGNAPAGGPADLFPRVGFNGTIGEEAKSFAGLVRPGTQTATALIVVYKSLSGGWVENPRKK